MKKRIFRFVAITLGLLAFSFFSYAMVESWNQIALANLSPQINWIIPVGLLVLASVISGVMWQKVAQVFIGISTSFREALGVHCGAWIMRYTPTVGSIAYKALWLVSKGIRLRFASVPIIIESLYVQFSSFLVGILLLAPRWIQFGSIIIVMLFLGLLAAPIGAAYLLNSSLAARLFSLGPGETVVSRSNRWIALILLAGYSIPRLVTATAVGIAAQAVENLDLSEALAVGAAFLISAALGFLVPFVPSGIGIREGVFVAFLSAFGWDTPDAVTLSILLRFLTTVSDLVVGALWLGLRRGIEFEENTKGKPS